MPKAVLTITLSWERIHKALGEVETDHLQSLEKAAKADVIAKLEAALGVALPTDFKESLAIHNGQKGGAEVGAFPGLYHDEISGSYFLLGSKAIARHWKDLRAVKKAGDFDDSAAEPDRGVSAFWWNEAWIPFAANGGGDYLCIDLKPATGGTVGQIVCFEGNAGRRRIIARSLSAWLARQAEVFEAGDLPDMDE